MLLSKILSYNVDNNYKVTLSPHGSPHLKKLRCSRAGMLAFLGGILPFVVHTYVSIFSEISSAALTQYLDTPKILTHSNLADQEAMSEEGILTHQQASFMLRRYAPVSVSYQTLKHAAARCNTLQHAAICCNTLQHAATHCNTLQHTATHCNTLQQASFMLRHYAPVCARCNSLQHAAIRCNTLQRAATCCNTIQQASFMLLFNAPVGLCCNSQKHAVTLYNTL